MCRLNESLETSLPILNITAADLQMKKNEKITNAVPCHEEVFTELEVRLNEFNKTSNTKIKEECINVNPKISAEEKEE